MTEQEIKEKALKAYPYDIQGQYDYDANDGKRKGYIKGYQEAIQQMIKDAIEATVHGVSGREGSTMKGIALTAYADVPACKFGDKVKLIIIKED